MNKFVRFLPIADAFAAMSKDAGELEFLNLAASSLKV